MKNWMRCLHWICRWECIAPSPIIARDAGKRHICPLPCSSHVGTRSPSTNGIEVSIGGEAVCVGAYLPYHKPLSRKTDASAVPAVLQEQPVMPAKKYWMYRPEASTPCSPQMPTATLPQKQSRKKYREKSRNNAKKGEPFTPRSRLNSRITSTLQMLDTQEGRCQSYVSPLPFALTLSRSRRLTPTT